MQNNKFNGVNRFLDRSLKKVYIINLRGNDFSAAGAFYATEWQAAN